MSSGILRSYLWILQQTVEKSREKLFCDGIGELGHSGSSQLLDYYLKEAAVTVYMDHKACVALLTSKRLNNRLARRALKLEDWEIQIIKFYRPGKANGNADWLSHQDFDDDSLQESFPDGDQSCPTAKVLAGGACG